MQPEIDERKGPWNDNTDNMIQQQQTPGCQMITSGYNKSCQMITSDWNKSYCLSFNRLFRSSYFYIVNVKSRPTKLWFLIRIRAHALWPMFWSSSRQFSNNSISRFAKLLAQYASLLTEINLRPQNNRDSSYTTCHLVHRFWLNFITALHTPEFDFSLQFARHSGVTCLIFHFLH